MKTSKVVLLIALGVVISLIVAYAVYARVSIGALLSGGSV
jgi:hypothetical protein